MSRAKELLERIYRERDFFGGMEHRITQAAAEDAEDFAVYEAAVEALERLTGQVISQPDQAKRLWEQGRAALAALHDEVAP